MAHWRSLMVLILNDHGNNLAPFRISLESFRSLRDPLLLKPVTGQDLFFAISYSNPALVYALVPNKRVYLIIWRLPVHAVWAEQHAPYTRFLHQPCKDVYIVVHLQSCQCRTANLNGLRMQRYRLAQKSWGVNKFAVRPSGFFDS